MKPLICYDKETIGLFMKVKNRFYGISLLLPKEAKWYNWLIPYNITRKDKN